MSASPQKKKGFWHWLAAQLNPGRVGRGGSWQELAALPELLLAYPGGEKIVVQDHGDHESSMLLIVWWLVLTLQFLQSHHPQLTSAREGQQKKAWTWMSTIKDLAHKDKTFYTSYSSSKSHRLHWMVPWNDAVCSGWGGFEVGANRKFRRFVQIFNSVIPCQHESLLFLVQVSK